MTTTLTPLKCILAFRREPGERVILRSVFEGRSTFLRRRRD
jgi:hypothetical protein